MATFTGHDGVIKLADTGDSLTSAAIGNLRNFTIEQTQDTVETTSMGSTGNMRTYKPGLSTFTISGDVYFDGSDSVQAKLDDLVSKTGDESLATFEVYPSGETVDIQNTKFTGSCVITSFSVTSSVDGVVEASFAAQGSGQLIQAQVTS
tara:strand:+ start:207 stop:653 length:447 start_codon:yes stop_codon:yes gene_type:complete